MRSMALRMANGGEVLDSRAVRAEASSSTSRAPASTGDASARLADRSKDKRRPPSWDE